MTEASKDISVDIQSPADLLELKSKLLDELKTLEIAKATAELDSSSSDTKSLQNSVAGLKDKLLEESNNVSLQRLIIKRLETQELLCEMLFKKDKDDREADFTKKCVDDLHISSEMMRILKDVGALQEKHFNLRMDNLKLKRENATMVKKLKAQQEKAQAAYSGLEDDKEYRMLKAELDVRSKSLSILKSIIPRLAIGAGVLNQDVQELILQCGEPSNI